MLNSIIRMVGGDPNRRDIERFSDWVDEINALEVEYQDLDDAALREKTKLFRERLGAGEALDDILPEAFAAVREASRRTIGLRHYDVQMIGGIVLHLGRVAEMRTGEGKTLVATLPLYLNALSGQGAHLITVNDYLARRDARWMGRIYDALGLTVGVLQEASRTDNARKAFLFDPERESPQEDANQLRLVDRRLAYAADITYGTNNEFGFDYLRDNLALRREERVQRGRNFAIVDEVDNILIDEARTPLIISGPAAEEQTEYKHMAQVVRQLRPEDYEINERDRTAVLTEAGEGHVEELLGQPLSDPDRPEDVTPEQARLTGHLSQAMRAELLFRRNRDYLVQGGQVVIVDEFTGRLMHGRRWSDGLHQAVEAKEGLEVQPENVTYATITLQNYFRLYAKLSGMTGTALTEAEEFDKIYKLNVVPIPTNLEYIASRAESDLLEVPYKEESNKFFFFARKTDPKTAVFWRRKDYKDVIFRTEEAKYRAVCTEILTMHALGRPVLMGTTSVERSEVLSERMRAEPLRKLALTIILRDAWCRANNIQEDGRLIEELQPLAQPLNALTPAVLRTIAKPLNAQLNPEDPANVDRLLSLLTLPEESRPRLLGALQKGIPHQVLNAKKHAEESQIITGAGAFGGVTIATNMAGRGVDIKLGGELAEEIVAAINRVLRRSGVSDPYDITNAERLAFLDKANAEQIGVYGTEVEFFRKHMREEQKVRELGGLHVLGSERHEARRIDNQLRGRAGRQGDPGSSRFFLSMEDDLMRRFGGEQVSGMMQTMRIDDAVPLESGLVGRMIEQAQTRVEGANFDVRKHLIEYDDVLNKQRGKVYDMRERIYEKDDLSDDIDEMLKEDIRRHIALSKKDEEPWKLIGWLEDVQPTLRFSDGSIRPSFANQVIIETLMEEPSARRMKAIVDLAARALEEEALHLRASFDKQMESISDRARQWERENRESLETAFEGAEIEAREKGEPLAPRRLVDAAAAVASIDGKAVPRELLVPEKNRDLRQHLLSLTGEAAWMRASTQAAAWLQRRTGLLPERAPSPDEDFDAAVERLHAQLEKALDDRRTRVLQEVSDQIKAAGESAADENALAGLLAAVTMRTQTFFDQRTHQRRAVSAAQFSWIHLAAKLAMDGTSRGDEELEERVETHLLESLNLVSVEWGRRYWHQVAEQTLDSLAEDLQTAIREKMPGAGTKLAPTTVPMREWPEHLWPMAIEAIGHRVIRQAHRELMLGVIGQSWVEYLTQMEALRTSIGLEAYAQRDPLVQYKSSAFDLFQALMTEVRSGVVSRLFHISLRSATPAAQAAAVEARPFGPELPAPADATSTPAVSSKRKRHRH